MRTTEGGLFVVPRLSTRGELMRRPSALSSARRSSFVFVLLALLLGVPAAAIADVPVTSQDPPAECAPLDAEQAPPPECPAPEETTDQPSATDAPADVSTDSPPSTAPANTRTVPSDPTGPSQTKGGSGAASTGQPREPNAKPSSSGSTKKAAATNEAATDDAQIEAVQEAHLKDAHVGATNPGFETGECPDNPFNDNTWGWHFVLQGNSTTFVTLSATFQNAGTITQFLSHPDAKHAYVWTPGPDTLLGATATVDGPDTEFNLSHVCPGTTPPDEGSLSVVKAIQGTPGGPFTINVTCTLDNVEVVNEDLIFAGAGQQQVDNIPAGAECNVTETDNGGATSVQYSDDPPQNITIVADEVAGPVTVTNTFGEDPEVGALEVTKEIEGPLPQGAQFLVHVTCTVGDTTVVDQDLPLFTSDGESHSITGIPAGAECTVEETGNFGAAVSYSPDPPVITIVEEETAAVTVTNTYGTGELRVVKEVEGTAPSGAEFEVHVVCEFANQTVVDETLTFGANGGSETISDIPAGAECTIEETGTSGAAVSYSPDPPVVTIVAEETVTVTVTNDFRTPPPTTTPTSPTTVPSDSTPSPTVAPNVVTPTVAPNVVAPTVAGTSAGRLAFTGSWTFPMVLVAFGLALLGAVLLVVARRTSSAESVMID
jgi:hypothetical protein